MLLRRINVVMRNRLFQILLWEASELQRAAVLLWRRAVFADDLYRPVEPGKSV